MVIWSEPAKADLKHIHDHIAEDSKHYAKKVVHDIREKTNVLDTLPRGGKMVPEIGNPDIRELHIYSYRIMYEVKDKHCDIFAVIHQRRNFSVEDLP